MRAYFQRGMAHTHTHVYGFTTKERKKYESNCVREREKSAGHLLQLHPLRAIEVRSGLLACPGGRVLFKVLLIWKRSCNLQGKEKKKSVYWWAGMLGMGTVGGWGREYLDRRKEEEKS